MSTEQSHEGQFTPPAWTSQPPSSSYSPQPVPFTSPPPQQNAGPLPTYEASYQSHAEPYRQSSQSISFNQPAPRQRTAIACRYCRRRKIRCSGFESSEDGRCLNCIRFNQDCLFTPVSSQTQAFVPAHTAYPHLRSPGGQSTRGSRPGSFTGPSILYGAHGQPLPMISLIPNHEPYSAPQQPVSGAQGYVSIYSAAQQEFEARRPPPQEEVSRKRPRLSTDTSHSLTYEPPAISPPATSFSQQMHSMTRESGPTNGFEYPDPTTLAPVSPVNPVASYPGVSGSQQHPYYTTVHPQVGRRESPQSGYSFDNRGSGSPHGSVSSISSGAPFYHGQLHPPQTLPPTREVGRTPPPPLPISSQQSIIGGRSAITVRDMLSPDGSCSSQGGRSSTDSGMVDALNRRGMS